jgi:hypothetical protein
MDPDVARMAGANLAAGQPNALADLRKRLEAGSLQIAARENPGLSEAATKWLASGERGISSNTMFTVMTGVDATWDGDRSHPHDPDDLDRCLALLHDVPELRAKLPLMAASSPAWAALIANWEKIEASHLNEVGLGWTKGGSAPETYKLMRAVLDNVAGK